MIPVAPSLPWPDPSHAFVAVATLAVFLGLRRYLYPRHPSVIPGPLKTALPGLAKDEIERLDYRPDAFPGARDVVTPVSEALRYRNEWRKDPFADSSPFSMAP